MRGDEEGREVVLLLRSKWRRRWRPGTALSHELKEKQNTELTEGSGDKGFLGRARRQEFGFRFWRASGANRKNTTGGPNWHHDSPEQAGVC